MKRWMTALTAFVLTTALTAGAVAESVQPLPVYRAQERNQEQANFFDKVNPAWFNQSGEPSLENWSKRGRYDHLVFPDQAQLDVDVNVINYAEYDGTRMFIYADDPENPEGPFPRKSFASSIGDLASNRSYYARRDLGGPTVHLDKTELSGVTLENAKAQVEALLEKLGMEGYVLAEALDMSVERIRSLGAYEAQERQREQREAEANGGGVNVDTGIWDFTLATEADEGFFLYYTKTLNGLPVGVPAGGGSYVSAFVNASGICRFRLWDEYAIGDVYGTPDRLLTMQEAQAAFERDNAKRERDLARKPIFAAATLSYAPRRAADKKDGLVMEPMWYIQYAWEQNQPAEGWAWYSAVDGKLIQDCYTE